ncbi:MAG: hypothetical protein JNM72_07100 [Deltaproteobacteria bacterium]|nr:hypothetical protein [Deltaproteobacteria bacterium]
MSLPTAGQALDAGLARCPAHARAVIGPLAQALLPALRPAPARPTAGPGAPDGLEGWARRGPMHRLLHSEWALLDAAPDEFLRRAADQELAFLQLRAEAPRPPALPVALLDAGPAQLGLPRLAQAAALAARAAWCAAAGEALRWGAIQADPEAEGWLQLGLGEGWLQRLFGLRCLRPASAEALRAAEAGLAAQGLRAPLLLLGGRPAHALPEAEIIELHSVETDEGPAVELRRDGAPLRRWAAPAEAAAAFGPAPAPRPRSRPRLDAPLALRPGFFFCPSGARLLGLTTEGEAVAIPVPAVGSADEARIATRALVGIPVALGWIQGKIASLCWDDEHDTLRVDLRGRVASQPRPDELELPLVEELDHDEVWEGDLDPGQAPLGMLCAADDGAGALVLPQPGACIDVYAHDDGVHVYGWPATMPAPPSCGAPGLAVVVSTSGPPRAQRSAQHPVLGDGRAWGVTKDRALASLFGGRSPSRKLVMDGKHAYWPLQDQAGNTHFAKSTAGAARLWTACVGPYPRAWVALRRQPAPGDKVESWGVRGALDLSLPATTHTLWGIFQPGGSGGHPVALIEEAGALSLRWGRNSAPVAQTGALRWAAASPRGDAVAWLDQDGVLHIVRPHGGEVIATLRPPAEAAGAAPRADVTAVLPAPAPRGRR